MPKPRPHESAPAERPSFEESLAALEGIVADLEEGELGLSESLARYEEGVRRLKDCYAELEQAERRIDLLTGLDEDGAPRTVPLDDAELSLPEKAESRSRRRTALRTPTSEVDEDGGAT